VYHYQFEAFSVPCELHIDASTASIAETAAKIVFENAKRLEHRYSFFRNDSEIQALNTRSSNIHLISDEMAGFIKLSLFYTDISLGAFDIAMAGTLKESSNASSTLEYHAKRKTLLPFASSSHLSLEGNCLTFTNPITKIDLGGLVKEYAVDQSVLQLQSMEITSGLVNFGGDIAAFGTCHVHAWRVGIQNPENPESNLVEIELNTASLCTSGHSKRYSIIQSEKISHIIAPSDAAASYSQVSILAPTTVDAGIWSTALLVNPKLILPNHIKMVHSIT
jgi:thiamine biosynthesis lipoprotein